MSSEFNEEPENTELSNSENAEESETIVEGHSDKKNSKYAKLLTIADPTKPPHLGSLYQNWFLDYASYVVLERAIPHLLDGLKPVQRRILHTMKKMDDGRYNKVANVIGETMKYHPHGDMAIGNALVQLGQKELLIDTQGNWGNILTGDSSAAPRYIEARLTKFALEIAFNPKNTVWTLSYDGRNEEPVNLPVKFPLLLVQGVEGIGVGLASKILPHNFNEVIDAAIGYLEGKNIAIFPDFPTGGFVDITRYNNGLRGGAVKVRAKIIKKDSRTLAITEIPFSRTTTAVIESILKANEKSKIKIKKVDDNTAANVEILVHLANDVNPDKTIDGLYAFTDCEISIAPNACVIYNNKPEFISVTEILQRNVEHTKTLLKQELEIRLAELNADWHYSSLEKIFFEQRIYKILEKDSDTWKMQLQEIHTALNEFRPSLKRDITLDDVTKLCEKPVRKISKFDIKAADEHIKAVEKEMIDCQAKLDALTQYTIDWFKKLKQKYGADKLRKTQICNFENIEVTEVAVANAQLFVNKKEGFVGTGLKKDEDAEFISDCSDIDDIIIFLKDGRYVVKKVTDKSFVGKDILHVAVFKRNDERTIYNALYVDGKSEWAYYKRFFVTGTIRDKEYDLTKGNPKSKVLWLSANRNGEAEVLEVKFKPRYRMQKLLDLLDFKSIEIKNRGAQGNIFSKNAIQKITLKEKGVSTIGGTKIWFDKEIKRINLEERGEYLGEFFEDDKIISLTQKGMFITNTFDLSTRFEEDILFVRKFNPKDIFTAIYFDAGQSYYYLKRFTLETSFGLQSFIDPDNPNSTLTELSTDDFPQVEVIFGGKHAKKPIELIDAEEFIGVKSFRAKGKRVSTFEIDKIRFTTPLHKIKEETADDKEHNEELEELPIPDASNITPVKNVIQKNLFEE